MSEIQFAQTPGAIGQAATDMGFSQAVSIPANVRIVLTSGQIGCDLKTGKLVTSSAADQINAAFDCVDAALRSAGVREGIKGVHKIVAYFVQLEFEPLMMEIWRERYPYIRPTWASVGVQELVVKGMIVEIQAEATTH